jgi:hypothetical protein
VGTSPSHLFADPKSLPCKIAKAGQSLQGEGS